MGNDKKKSLFVQYANLECEVNAPLEWHKYFFKLYAKSPFINCSTRSIKNLNQAKLNIEYVNTKDITLTFFYKPARKIFTVRASATPIFLFPSVHQFIAQIFNVLFHFSGGFVLHASSILIDDGVIIFVGEAESGKSTIVDLIKKRKSKSVILSDNSAFIMKKNSKFVLYPSPFLEANRLDSMIKHTPKKPPYPVKLLFSPLKAKRHKIKNFSFYEKVSLIKKHSHIPFMPDKLFNQKEIKEFGKLIFNFIDNVDLYQIQFRLDSGFIPLLLKKISQYG